jgi:hypothetical protein
MEYKLLSELNDLVHSISQRGSCIFIVYSNLPLFSDFDSLIIHYITVRFHSRGNGTNSHENHQDNFIPREALSTQITILLQKSRCK